MHKVVITDHGYKSVEIERGIIGAAGGALEVGNGLDPAALLELIRDADALLVQWAKIDAATIAQLTRCQVIVRYGIGVDNVDLAAARARGIAVCNVPDYGIDEVADHAVALALALGRQLPQIDRRTRAGLWRILPVARMPAFREMTFATAGFGRIARATLERARGFKFKLAAYDPYVPAEVFVAAGVRSLTVDELFAEADVLSLHLPASESTRHFVSAGRLSRMKNHAILVNTARGPLVDEAALAAALEAGVIGAAGLDVFQEEPLAANSALRTAPNVLVTSHVAWYSEKSVPTLQHKAAEEVARALRGEPLLNRIG
jgi:D-3-phosphoglycerate dehydrogenase